MSPGGNFTGRLQFSGNLAFTCVALPLARCLLSPPPALAQPVQSSAYLASTFLALPPARCLLSPSACLISLHLRSPPTCGGLCRPSPGRCLLSPPARLTLRCSCATFQPSTYALSVNFVLRLLFLRRDILYLPTCIKVC